SGYITFSKCQEENGNKICTLVVPNQEIKNLFRNLIQNIFEESLDISKIESLYDAISTGNGLKFAELLQEFVQNSMSAFDIPATEPEKSYHLFVLGLLVILSDCYEVKSNRESGDGRYDIMLIPRDKHKRGIVIEFKKVSQNTREALEGTAASALDQIR